MNQNLKMTGARRLLSMLLVMAMVFTTAAALAGCDSDLLPVPSFGSSSQKAETEETVPPAEPVVTGNGNSGDVLCKTSYTVEADQVSAVKNDTVAMVDDVRLTNAQLQAFYYMEIADYISRGNDVMPDFSIPLDCQLCPLDGGKLSWQHWFLQRAVQSWYTQQAIYQRTQEPQLITEYAFEPKVEWHEKYLSPEQPAYDLIYGDKAKYTPNLMHQAYLDELPDTLDALAAQKGYANLAELTSQVFGTEGGTDLAEAARLYNMGYMYYTEIRYTYSDENNGKPSTTKKIVTFDKPAEERPEAAPPVELEPEEMPDEIPGKTVSIRHWLILPENCTVGKDGKVSASAADWEQCEKDAKARLVSWKGNWLTNKEPESSFARMTNEESVDLGTKLDGGLYVNLTQGQLDPELDSWCFDPERKVGDTTVLRTEYGMHLLYMKDMKSNTQAEIESRTTYKREAIEIASILEAHPLTNLDYSKACLWTDTANGAAISLEDTLYPDIAHQRFPVAIVYLQQDYPHSYYGGGTVSRGGCGITTMAMLATYMTDTIYTPDQLACNYGVYRTAEGTNGDIFRYVPAELGFYLDYQTPHYDDVVAALNQGRRVISLQILGHFTSAGHYLLLERMNPDGTTIVVRDSNIFNYGKLKGHNTDSFTQWEIMSGSQIFWVLQDKITAIPACSRCGDPENTDMPHGMLKSDYLCEKCTVALSRRNDFLTLCDSYKAEN